VKTKYKTTMVTRFFKIFLFLLIASIFITCKKDFLYEESPLLKHNTDSIQLDREIIFGCKATPKIKSAVLRPT